MTTHPRLAQKEVLVSVDIPDTKDVSKVTYNGQEIPLDGSIKRVKEAKDE